MVLGMVQSLCDILELVVCKQLLLHIIVSFVHLQYLALVILCLLLRVLLIQSFVLLNDFQDIHLCNVLQLLVESQALIAT